MHNSDKVSLLLSVWDKAIDELHSIIFLNVLNGYWKSFYQMIQEFVGRIRAVFFNCFHIAPVKVFVNGCNWKNYFPFTFLFARYKEGTILRLSKCVGQDTVNNPELLILDEPFPALDSYFRTQMEQEVWDMVPQFGKIYCFFPTAKVRDIIHPTVLLL